MTKKKLLTISVAEGNYAPLDKYPILGEKSLDYADWRKAMEIIKTKTSLTTEGLNQILQIKAGMNKERNRTNFRSSEVF